jgi:hypothetical protein
MEVVLQQGVDPLSACLYEHADVRRLTYTEFSCGPRQDVEQKRAKVRA